MELVEDLAYPLPVVIICEMLGVPPSDHERFKGWSRDLARGLDPDFVQPVEALERRFETVLAFHEYFRELIARRRSDPGDDLLTALCTPKKQGDTLTEDELLGICTLLLVAGHETTVNLIGNGVLALLRHRDQLERLWADRTLIKSAVEEILRFDPPVQFDGRVAMADDRGGRSHRRAGRAAPADPGRRQPRSRAVRRPRHVRHHARPTTGTSRSGTASISASARRSPDSRASSRSARSSGGCR